MIRKKILNFFYPNFCPLCETFLTAEELLCDVCGEKMLLGQDDYCHHCGKVSCMCQHHTPSYDKAVIACRYDKQTSPAVICLKNSRNTNFAYFAAQIIAQRLQYGQYYGTFDAIIPVPMHISKQRLRGYNQAALIAKEISRLLDVPFREDVLYKPTPGTEQHLLKSVQERARNVNAFKAYPVSLENQKILLCDDVLTTGSTMSRCATLLKENGAFSVTAAAASTTAPKKKENPE